MGCRVKDVWLGFSAVQVEKQMCKERETERETAVLEGCT